MTFTRWTAVLPAAALLSIALFPHAAAAQSSAGPMTVQRIGDSVLIAPDFKITDFNGKATGLAGAYGGYLLQNTFLLGAGGYWLTDTSRERDMWYVGVVTGVYLHQDRRLGYGFKALIGGGEATFSQQYTYLQPQRGGAPVPIVATNFFHNNIFVFEPEADVVWHLSEHMKLTGGVGYRLTAQPYYGYNGCCGYSNGRINGVTGSVALQIVGGT
jgi:hypothetical protein